MAAITITQHPNHEYPSTDTKNSIVTGGDGYLFKRQLAFVVVKATPPTAVDFGLPEIPPGAVWVTAPAPSAWCDDFDGAALGPNWVPGPTFKQGTEVAQVENIVGGGAWTAGQNDEPLPTAVYGTIRTTVTVPATQTIEAIVGNLFQGHDPSVVEGLQWMESDLWLFTQVVGGSSNACLGAHIVIQTNQGADFSGGCYMELMTVAADGTRSYFGDGTYEPLAGWQTNPNYTIRLETTAAGHCKASFDGHLVVEGDLAPTGGAYVGAAQQWNRTNYASTVANLATSPRFDRICVNKPTT